MKNNENKRVSILVEDDHKDKAGDGMQAGTPGKFEKLKKPLIFALMSIVFLGCMYLIFKPSGDKNKVQEAGLNDAVPQATDADLQADKQKAYEQELLEQKEEEKRNALMSLSDYWNKDTTKDNNNTIAEQEVNDADGVGPHSKGSPALNSYRSARNAIGSFYQKENSETQELRRQLDELKQQLGEQQIPQTNTVQDQLALMEKSYEMASKYLPSGNSNTTLQGVKGDSSASVANTQKEHFVAFTPVRKNAVSALYREPTDSAFLASLGENRNRGFYTADKTAQVARPKNSIRACAAETQVVTGETGVPLRLLEPAITPVRTIPQGTILTANAKFQNGRLQLKVTSIELEGSFIPVDITIYDLDGQQGLFVPYSPEMNALTEIASNMSQTSASSITMTRSAGQQVAGDLSRGLIQGISGYFSKKIKTPKVTLKAGHQVFLVPKNLNIQR